MQACSSWSPGSTGSPKGLELAVSTGPVAWGTRDGMVPLVGPSTGGDDFLATMGELVDTDIFVRLFFVEIRLASINLLSHQVIGLGSPVVDFLS